MNEEFNKSLPPIVYKFRDWSNPFHKKTLTHDSLFMAKQETLNDPIDALLPFSYKKEQMTKENIIKKLYETAQKKWPEKTKQQLDEFIKTRMEEVDFETDEYWIKTIPVFQSMVNSKIGILSLSHKWDSISLWTHYGNSHKGLCLGFNTEHLFQSIGGLIGKVDYSDQPNEVDLFDSSHHGLAKALLQKSTDFSFESEVRITKYGYAGKPILFPNGSLEKVILGTKMSEKDKTEILGILQSLHRYTKVYQALIDNSTRKLIKVRIF